MSKGISLNLVDVVVQSKGLWPKTRYPKFGHDEVISGLVPNVLLHDIVYLGEQGPGTFREADMSGISKMQHRASQRWESLDVH